MFLYNLLFKQKLEHKLSDGFIKWGLKHKNETNNIVKIFMDEYSVFRGNILLFLFVNFLLFEFCQNFVDSRHLKGPEEKYYNDKRFAFSNA